MEKNITIADVAEALGVSKTTVSRAISGKGRIGEETRRRVMQYIEEHDYKPNVIAQGLAKSRTFNLAVVMPTDYCLVDFPFFQNCLVGMHEVASSLGYDLLLTICNNVDMSHLERIISNRKVDGIVLMRTLVEDKTIQLLSEKGFPFVAVGSTKYQNVIQVDQNHHDACKELTSILLMKKMRKIALVGGSENHVVTQSRLNGYLDAHMEMGVPVQKELIFLNQETPVMVENAVDMILQKGVDCIACMDDGICSNVLNKLKKERVQIPTDIKVASFFNSTVLENNIPGITSLSFDVKEEGRVAVHTLIDMIEGMEVESRTLLGYDVVLKDSTK
ncbi:MAG: LacI family DNA-binding transcriptional regulator [Roseburia sp.]